VNKKRFGSIAAIAVAGAVVLSSSVISQTATAAPNSSAHLAASLSGTLNGVGSSAQAVAETTWAAGFQTKNSNVTVNYNPLGSGAGLTSFESGAAEFGGSDAYLADSDLQTGTFANCAAGTTAIDIPVYISPIALAYNVDGVKNLTLDAKTIAGIFKGTITKWNDSAIKKLNKGVKLPSASITVVHRSDNSGTTYNFTQYLASQASDVWTAAASQTFPYSVGDAAKGTSGVESAVENATNSIAYIDESGAGPLSIAKLMVGGKATKISAKGASNVVAASPFVAGRSANDLAIGIDRTAATKGDWPITLVSYMLVCQQYKTASVGTLVKAYASYATSAAGQKAAAQQAGSAPLSKALTAKVAKAIKTIK
jgi:phosphate transport system substrate-binding protein